MGQFRFWHPHCFSEVITMSVRKPLQRVINASFVSSKLVPSKLKKPKLITFDAFGTLYTPRDDIPQLYSSIVKKHSGIYVPPESLRANFPVALKEMLTLHPHYGKHTLVQNSAEGFDHTRQWWSSVLKKTFAPVELPEATINALYDYFDTEEAYFVYDDVIPALDALAKDGIPIALVSNSDSRVFTILENLKLLRYVEGRIFLSHEIGFEKPDPRLFHHVKDTLSPQLAEGDECWHLGDDLEKDIKAASNVPGWRGILIDRTNEFQPADLEDVLAITDLRDLPSLYN